MTHRKNNSLNTPPRTERLLYFAYGSNLDREKMKLRCPGSKALCPAHLAGYRLVEREFADIEPDADSVVHGALYSITASDLESLDFYEGYPSAYTRKRVPAIQKNGLIQMAYVYLMTPECRKLLEGRPYSEDYRKVCSDGAASWGITNAFTDKEP